MKVLYKILFFLFLLSACTEKPVPEIPLNRAEKSQILSELFRVVYIEETVPPSRSQEYFDLLETFDQGAGIEGLHNGLTHSKEYRELEESPKTHAPMLALSLFCREFESLLKEFEKIPELTEQLGGALSRPIMPDEDGRSEPAAKKIDAKTFNEQKCREVFVLSSVFTLKRVLANLALELMDEKKENPKKLRNWYGKWAAHMGSYQVDFGLKDRNHPDEAFHRDWTRQASGDLRKWEVLNRIHRSLNSFYSPSKSTK